LTFFLFLFFQPKKNQNASNTQKNNTFLDQVLKTKQVGQVFLPPGARRTLYSIRGKNKTKKKQKTKTSVKNHFFG